MRFLSSRRLFFITLGLLLPLIAWDTSDLDMRLAGWSGNAQGFPLTEQRLLTTGLHQGGRALSWLVAVGLVLAVWWPVGWLRRLEKRERVQLIGSTFAAVLLISVLKSASPTSCPWDLSAFGGTARHLSHWAWAADGGGGHCFPAGHASSGFAFMAGYFVFRRRSPAIARFWLASALIAGLTFGLGQQLRGAHFMSHTLWAAWLCWAVAWAVDAAFHRPDRPGKSAKNTGV